MAKKYNVEWNFSEWMEYQGFRTQNVCAFHTEEDHILSEDEVKNVAVDWLGDTMSCDGILWNVRFSSGDDTAFAEPDAEVIVWTYPEDL